MSMAAGLADFARDHQRAKPALSSRATAFVLTVLLFGCFAFLFSQRSLWNIPDRTLVSETVMRLMPEMSRIVYIRPPQPMMAHLIRPRAEDIAPPSFTVAAETPPAPATLAASAAKTSPLDGGAPDGAGTAAQAVSSNGSSGTGAGAGTTPSACFDAAWMQAVTNRVQHFFFYPDAALARHIHGVAMVHIIVRHNGYVDLVEIGTSSGNRLLDAAAVYMVHTALPLPEIPDRMHTDKADVLLPVDFGNTGPAKPAVGSCGG
jgi:protein TonB